MSETPETQIDAILSKLNEEILRDPPIRARIEFHWNGTQELADQVTAQVSIHSALLRRQAPWLDFSSLTQIVFHQDYDQGLREASARTGREMAPTREPGGLSLAMVVHKKDGCELIADAGLARAILSEEESVSGIGVNTLRHELCHVDDFARKRRVWESEFLALRLTGIRATFFPIAEALWNEYYANRVSDSALADAYLTGEEDMLAGAVRAARQEVEGEITSFRVSHDVTPLRNLAVRKLSFVAMCVGYVLGRYAAREISGPRSPALLEALQQSGFEKTFSESLSELDRLFRVRDSWKSTQDFGALEQIWFRAMCDLGLRFQDRDRGRVYIHVPFR